MNRADVLCVPRWRRGLARALLALCAGGTALLLGLADEGRAWGESFYCGSDLINRGDLKHQVQSRCGPPTTRETWSVEEREPYHDAAGVRRHRVTRIPMEQWIYDFGAQRFVRILLFKAGVLVEISTSDRHGA